MTRIFLSGILLLALLCTGNVLSIVESFEHESPLQKSYKPLHLEPVALANAAGKPSRTVGHEPQGVVSFLNNDSVPLVIWACPTLKVLQILVLRAVFHIHRHQHLPPPNSLA